ncbi:COX assembly mitochondrial protein 2 homolog [Teleopsis dalmanni]|uniref:COX assembly mitochondrial protein 2 homolog n=1 Tax=Teleopsis dalmanni TaxID=139649 RepID=UPI000D32B33B|nr:COX assembly mitochondrial protein 2 homolog [Teleopsis dalmanni]
MNKYLKPDLPTPECMELFQKLANCHEKNKLAKFLGTCNSFEAALRRCVKREHEERAAANHEESKKKLKELHERLRRKPSS